MSDLLPAGGRALRILDFDIENRPLSYWMADRPTAQITAIASAWVGDHESMRVDLYDGTESSYLDMLNAFVDRYKQADMVTGHYIRRHDLPIINGALYELKDFGLLDEKLTCDTKLDMFKKADIPATQEFLLEVLDPRCPKGIPIFKQHMSQRDWREANTLSADGLQKTAVRVSSDVHAHEHMRDAMLTRGWLKRPSMWRPGGGFS